jgi:hypothetical protein
MHPREARPAQPDYSQTAGLMIVRAELTADLLPGGNATANLVTFGGSGWSAATAATITVYDPFFRCCALMQRSPMATGERINVFWTAEMLGSDGKTRYEVLGEYGLRRRGKTQAAIAKGSSGSVNIWYEGTDTLVTVTADNDFADVAISKWVWLEYINGGWYLNAAEC